MLSSSSSPSATSRNNINGTYQTPIQKSENLFVSNKVTHTQYTQTINTFVDKLPHRLTKKKMLPYMRTYSFSWIETEGLLIWNSHHAIVRLFWFTEWDVDPCSSQSVSQSEPTSQQSKSQKSSQLNWDISVVVVYCHIKKKFECCW